MLNKILKTSQNKAHQLVSDDEVIVDWFNRPEDTHTDIIINQINQGMYNRFFNGRQDLVVIDCGANIGLWTLYAQDSCKKIVAVEPAPHNVYILEQLTQGMDHVSCDMSALSMEDGEIQMNIHSSPTCNSILYETNTDLSIPVQTKTIETIMRDHDLDYVDFVKCDIEGAELLAFSAATLDPVKDRIGSWLIEVHQSDTQVSAWPGNLEQNRQDIMKLLRDAGYNTEPLLHDQIYAWKN
jgi:FkbM family methyltransferase